MEFSTHVYDWRGHFIGRKTKDRKDYLCEIPIREACHDDALRASRSHASTRPAGSMVQVEHLNRKYIFFLFIRSSKRRIKNAQSSPMWIFYKSRSLSYPLSRPIVIVRVVLQSVIMCGKVYSPFGWLLPPSFARQGRHRDGADWSTRSRDRSGMMRSFIG